MIDKDTSVKEVDEVFIPYLYKGYTFLKFVEIREFFHTQIYKSIYKRTVKLIV